MTKTYTCSGVAFDAQDGISLCRLQRAYAITLLDLDGRLQEHFDHYDDHYEMELRTTAEDFWNAHCPGEPYPWADHA